MSLRGKVSLFFNSAANANLVNTFIGGTVSTIEYYVDPNHNKDFPEQVGTVTGGSVAGLALPTINILRKHNSELSRTDKLISTAGVIYGVVTSTLIAVASFTVSGSPAPSITFTVSNGMLAGVNKCIADFTEEKKTSEYQPLLATTPTPP